MGGQGIKCGGRVSTVQNQGSVNTLGGRLLRGEKFLLFAEGETAFIFHSFMHLSILKHLMETSTMSQEVEIAEKS